MPPVGRGGSRSSGFARGGVPLTPGVAFESHLPRTYYRWGSARHTKVASGGPLRLLGVHWCCLWRRGSWTRVPRSVNGVSRVPCPVCHPRLRRPRSPVLVSSRSFTVRPHLPHWILSRTRCHPYHGVSTHAHGGFDPPTTRVSSLGGICPGLFTFTPHGSGRFMRPRVLVLRVTPTPTVPGVRRHTGGAPTPFGRGGPRSSVGGGSRLGRTRGVGSARTPGHRHWCAPLLSTSGHT